MHRILLPLALVTAGCGYEVPLRPKDDPRMRAVPNVMLGSVNLVGPEEPSQTMILVFDNENPGPPLGTSGPVDFATVDGTEFAGSPEYGFSAPFSVVEVPDGAYQVEAIVDMDGDFNPLAFTLGGATCGDWQGAYYAPPGSGIKGAVGLEGGEVLDGVQIHVDWELDTERPAFVFPTEDGYKQISLQAAGANPAAPLTYSIESTGIHAQYTKKAEERLDIDDQCTADAVDNRFCAADTTCESAFSVLYVDADGDGAMDPHPDYPPEFGLKDIWPRVFLEYLGTVEFDAANKVVRDENGYPVITPPDLPEGVFWGGENFPFGLEAAFGLPIVPAGTGIGQPNKMPQLTVMFPPLVAKFYPDGAPECDGVEGGCSELFDLSDPDQRSQVPKGVWGVNLISWTGQTWGLPNEISEWGVASTAESFDPSLQGGFLVTVP